MVQRGGIVETKTYYFIMLQYISIFASIGSANLKVRLYLVFFFYKARTSMKLDKKWQSTDYFRQLFY